MLFRSIPEGLDWIQAAAIPVSYLTAHNALFTLGRATSGASVLIHAVTSGVGLAALQLATLAKASLIAGSGTAPEKLERLAKMGLDVALPDPYSGFADRVLAASGQQGVQVVLDNIGGRLLNETMRCTALGGRIVNVGRLGGIETSIDLNLHALRRIELLGATFRTRSIAQHAHCVDAFVRDFGSALEHGTLRPLIDSVFAFDRLPEAVQRSANREQLGKIVVAL